MGTKLYVGNLSFGTTDQDLMELFGRFDRGGLSRRPPSAAATASAPGRPPAVVLPDRPFTPSEGPR